MKKKKLMMAIMALMLIITAKSTYAMQSRPDGTRKTNVVANYFFTEIRKMESTVLGLPTNFDTTTWLDSSGNGVDVHMTKNTEWGTAAMLSASAYGTAPSGQSSATTTGNETGVYQMASGMEYVAGIWDASNYNTSNIRSANSRYYNLYTSKSYISGDAFEANGWKGSSNDSSYFVDSEYLIFLRAKSGLFSYKRDDGRNNTGYGDMKVSSRAVMVIGAGL